MSEFAQEALDRACDDELERLDDEESNDGTRWGKHTKPSPYAPRSYTEEDLRAECDYWLRFFD